MWFFSNFFRKDGQKSKGKDGKKNIQKNIIAYGDCVGGDLIQTSSSSYRAVPITDIIKNKIVINGKEFIVDGKDVNIIKNTIFCNGQKVECGPLSGIVSIKWEGQAASIISEYSIECHGDVGGDIDADGSVKCGNVEGDINSAGNVNCGYVEGDINSDGDVIVNGQVSGDINADGNIFINAK